LGAGGLDLPFSFLITLYNSFFWSRFWIYAAKDEDGREKSQHMKNVNPRKENPGLLDETVGKSLQMA